MLADLPDHFRKTAVRISLFLTKKNCIPESGSGILIVQGSVDPKISSLAFGALTLFFLPQTPSFCEAASLHGFRNWVKDPGDPKGLPESATNAGSWSGGGMVQNKSHRAKESSSCKILTIF